MARTRACRGFWLLGLVVAVGPVAAAGDEISNRISPWGLVARTGEGPRLLGGLVLPGELFASGVVSPEIRKPFAAEAPDLDEPAVKSEAQPFANPGIGAHERLRVVLDPGHGGSGKSQQGAIGARGTREKVITWQMAQRIRRELAALPGVEVIMTRAGDEDVSMGRRVELANRVGADLFVSVHCNGNVARWYRGLETFFHSVSASSEEARRVASKENEVETGAEGAGDVVASILHDMQRAEVLRDSSRMAFMVHERLVKALGFPDHGVMQADFFVLRLTRMPAVLLEVGFITNPVEESEVRKEQVQEMVARAVRDAVVEFRQTLIRKQSAGRDAPGHTP